MKLLLHVCCGPCSIEPLSLLQEKGHDITIAYFNSNIAPLSEYNHRFDTLRLWAYSKNIPIIEETYNHLAWQNAIKSWNYTQPKAKRCELCYKYRFEKLAQTANLLGFEAIGTTLSISPYQYTKIIETQLYNASLPYPNVSVIFEDYRPFYNSALKKSRELGMYRQNYCGCLLSKKEAQKERDERKKKRKIQKLKEKKAKLQSLTTDDFDYELPTRLIAQNPIENRDHCKLLLMNRTTGALQDKIFVDIIDYLNPGDVLVANDTRVLPARLLGKKRNTQGQSEVLLLKSFSMANTNVEKNKNNSQTWEALVKPGKRLKPGAIVDFYDEADKVILSAKILDWSKTSKKGERVVLLSSDDRPVMDAIHEVGALPLPPYIKNYQGEKEMYQTVYSKKENSAAAPTAGLHFTNELIERLKNKGIIFTTVDLEVGLDTFRSVEENDPKQHHMHSEYYSVTQETIDIINKAKANKKRIIAVGTTSVRSLESAWQPNEFGKGELKPKNRESTDLYILPGFDFHVIDGLITNFHIPKSTLLMLVSAFSSRENILRAYRHAINRNYRMLSFGDAMFIY